MKKIILIFMLNFIFFSNLNAEPNKSAQRDLIKNNIIYIGMNFLDFKDVMNTKIGTSWWYSGGGIHALYGANQAYGDDIDTLWFSFETLKKTKKWSLWSGKEGNMELTKIWEDPIKGYDYHIGLETSPAYKKEWINQKSLMLNNPNYIAQKKINEKKIAEKRKKEKTKEEKQKPSPDDNKIVAAGSGSGFFVLQDGTIITNYHVIEGCELTKVSYKGSQVEAKILSIDKVNDIAILKTNIKPQSAFSISNEDVSLLEDVIVAGYPLGKEISSAIKTHKGVVTSLAGAGDNYSYFQTDAAINQGNSGGPIINQKGNVIGIAVQTWVEEGVQGVHFGIKSSTLKTFASANGLKFLPPNYKDLSNKDLGKLITDSTVYVECHMTIAKIKKMLSEMENKKAIFKEHK